MAVGNNFLRLFPVIVKARLLKNNMLFGVSAGGKRKNDQT